MFGNPRNVASYASTNSLYQTIYYYLNRCKESLVITNVRTKSAKMIKTERKKEKNMLHYS